MNNYSSTLVFLQQKSPQEGARCSAFRSTARISVITCQPLALPDSGVDSLFPALASTPLSTSHTPASQVTTLTHASWRSGQLRTPCLVSLTFSLASSTARLPLVPGRSSESHPLPREHFPPAILAPALPLSLLTPVPCHLCPLSPPSTPPPCPPSGSPVSTCTCPHCSEPCSGTDPAGQASWEYSAGSF